MNYLKKQFQYNWFKSILFFFIIVLMLPTCKKEEEKNVLTFSFSGADIGDYSKVVDIDITQFFDNYRIKNDTFKCISINSPYGELDAYSSWYIDVFFYPSYYKGDANYTFGAYLMNNWIEFTHKEPPKNGDTGRIYSFSSHFEENAGSIDLLMLENEKFQIIFNNVKLLTRDFQVKAVINGVIVVKYKDTWAWRSVK